MIWLLYVSEAALVVAAIALVPWMKREGDRSWRAHCVATRFRTMMAGVTERMGHLAAEMQKMTEPARRAADRLGALVLTFASATVPPPGLRPRGLRAGRVVAGRRLTRVEVTHRELVTALGYTESPTMAAEMWPIAERIATAIRVNEREG
jgi:hypothetical protein